MTQAEPRHPVFHEILRKSGCLRIKGGNSNLDPLPHGSGQLLSNIKVPLRQMLLERKLPVVRFRLSENRVLKIESHTRDQHPAIELSDDLVAKSKFLL